MKPQVAMNGDYHQRGGLSTGTGGRALTSSSKASKSVSYEIFAPRSQTQRNRLAELQSLAADPLSTSFSAANSHSKSNSNSSSTDKEKAKLAGNSGAACSFQNAMIPELQNDDKENQTSSSSSDQEHAIASTLQKVHHTSQHLSQILSSSFQLSQTLSQAMTLTQSLSSKHSTLLQHSSELSYNAEKLQSEYDMLIDHANDIGLPLKHYDDVDRLGVMVGVLFKNGVVVKGIARVKVDDDMEFNNVLDCINDAILFFERRVNANANVNIMSNLDASNASSSESGSLEYYKRSIVLQEAALELLKQAIVDRIDTTASQITNALQLNSTKNTVNGDILEASMIYTRFHGISSRSCHLVNKIYKRMNVVYIPNSNGSSSSSSSRSSSSRKKKRQTSANSSNHGNSDQQHQQGKVANHNEDYICPFTELSTLCRKTYISNRTQLLKMSIRNHLDFLKDKHGLIGMTRLASVFLMRLCTIETSLYLDFFGKEDIHGVEDEGTLNDEEASAATIQIDNSATVEGKSSSQSVSSSVSNSNPRQKSRDATILASKVMSKDGTYYDTEFQTYLDNLCNNLHRTVRRGLVSVLDLDTLCQIVSVLREERSLANASPTTMAAARSIGRVIIDAQERLIFCTNTVLSKEVMRFKATPADLDYPDKLRTWKKHNGSSDNPEDNTHKEVKEEDSLKQQLQIYESWFPPIRSILKVLSKIFRVVDPNVFEDIALTSIQACSRSLKEGSMHIEKKSGVLHSDLFLVKNLLVRQLGNVSCFLFLPLSYQD
jgi:hypothetical protein